MDSAEETRRVRVNCVLFFFLSLEAEKNSSVTGPESARALGCLSSPCIEFLKEG